jgi:hypothetical protein
MKIASALALLSIGSAAAFAPTTQKTSTTTALFGTKLPPQDKDNKGLEHIFEKNKKWQASMIAKDAKFFDKLGCVLSNFLDLIC